MSKLILFSVSINFPQLSVLGIIGKIDRYSPIGMQNIPSYLSGAWRSEPRLTSPFTLFLKDAVKASRLYFIWLNPRCVQREKGEGQRECEKAMKSFRRRTYLDGLSSVIARKIRKHSSTVDMYFFLSIIFCLHILFSISPIRSENLRRALAFCRTSRRGATELLIRISDDVE